MDGILDVDRCHGGESGTGREDDFPKTARSSALGPMLIVDEVSPTPTGFSKIYAKSCNVRQRISRPSQEQLCLDRKKEKAKAKLLGKLLKRSLFPTGEKEENKP